MATMMAKIGERGLQVTPAEGAAFPFDAIDVMIAQNMLAGCNTAKALAAAIGNVTDIAIAHRLLDPVRCAWLSQQLNHAVSTRLGMVINSVFGRAITTGDPKAAEFLCKKFGEMAPQRTENLNLNVGVDLTKLPPEVLEKMVAEKLRDLGIKRDVKEAECEVKDKS